MKHKAAVCVVRTSERGPELLVLRHPLAGVQIPKGSVEFGETAADAAVRELTEESGVVSDRVLRQIGQHELELGGYATDTGPLERQVWHTFLLVTGAELRDSWSHQASGSEVETGLVFDFFWLPIAEARAVAGPRYRASIDFVASARAADPGTAFAMGDITLTHTTGPRD